MLDDSALFTLRLALLVGAGVAAANGWGLFPGAAWSSRRLEGRTEGRAGLLHDKEAATTTPTPTPTTPAPTTTAAAAAAAAAAAPLMEPLQIRHANLLVAGLATCQMLMGLCLGGITATKP